MKNLWKTLRKAGIVLTILAASLTIARMLNVLPEFKIQIPSIELSSIGTKELVLHYFFIEPITFFFLLMLVGVCLFFISVRIGS